MDKFNSANMACEISQKALGAVAGDDQQHRDAFANSVYSALTNIREHYGQSAIDVLGNQLDLQDIRLRTTYARGTSYEPNVCPATSDLPGVIVGRDQNNHVTEITFIQEDGVHNPKARTLTWKSW